MRNSLFAIAAFVGISAAACIFYNAAESPQRLAYRYLQNSDFSLYGHRGRQPAAAIPSKDAVFEQVHQHIQKKENLVAIALLEDFLQQDPGNTEAQLQLGILYLKEQKMLSALPYLEEARMQRESIFSADASWFLALAKLHDEQIEAAQKLLQEVIVNQGNYYQQAQMLVGKISQ